MNECYTNTNAPRVTTKWVDTNKGVENSPDYRSRWVGRPFQRPATHRVDLFAVTLALEAKKALVAMAASQRDAPRDTIKKFGFIDIRKA